MGFSADLGGFGHMVCSFCAGKGRRIGAATTTSAECPTCNGLGYVSFAAHHQPPPGGLSAAGHGPDAARIDRSLVPDCDHVATVAESGPSPLPQQIEANLINARAL